MGAVVQLERGKAGDDGSHGVPPRGEEAAIEPPVCVGGREAGELCTCSEGLWRGAYLDHPLRLGLLRHPPPRPPPPPPQARLGGLGGRAGGARRGPAPPSRSRRRRCPRCLHYRRRCRLPLRRLRCRRHRRCRHHQRRRRAAASSPPSSRGKGAGRRGSGGPGALFSRRGRARPRAAGGKGRSRLSPAAGARLTRGSRRPWPPLRPPSTPRTAPPDSGGASAALPAAAACPNPLVCAPP